jgi:probable phosphoglycerate mutase
MASRTIAAPAPDTAADRRPHAMAARRAFLIRHGETAWTLSGQHTGTTDIPLTAVGRRVARTLQPMLARERLELVLTSPLERARHTSELAGFGRRAVLDPDLAEWNYGEFEGLTTAEIQRTAPGWLIFEHGCPGGESPEQVGARVDRVIDRIRTTAGNAAIFAHGHVLRVFAARWVGLPVAAGSHLLLDTATVSIVTYYRGIPAIGRWNSKVCEGGA